MRAYFRLKSEFPQNTIIFDDLINRLRAFIRNRIDSGEFTERSLARVLRVSQPHLHNMLKGVRVMNMQFADQVLTKFGASILDLITQEEIVNSLEKIDPYWLAQANKRKPNHQSGDRQGDTRAPWRTGS